MCFEEKNKVHDSHRIWFCNYVFGSSNFVAAILKMVHRNTRNMWTMPNTGETGKSVETLRFAEMLSSFAQFPGDVDSTA